MNKKWLAIFLVLTLIFVVGCQGTETREEIDEAVDEGQEEVEDIVDDIKEETTDKKVIIGSKPMAEQYILVEILSQLIEEQTDIDVEEKFGIAGGTSNLHPALLNGEIDMYPEYSGTGWLFVLKNELINDPDELYAETKKAYEEEYNVIWTEPYGFNNTFTLAMKKDKAEAMGIETFSDLGEKSDTLRFGAEYDFYERDDGFPQLSDLYNLNFKDKKEIDIALKYKAIGEDQVDVINAFSTDGLLKEYNMKILKDDKNFFPSYKAATIIRKETLEKYPELEDVLNKLSGAISEEEMIEMNFKVEKENQDPEDVAEEFLEKKGLKN